MTKFKNKAELTAYFQKILNTYSIVAETNDGNMVEYVGSGKAKDIAELIVSQKSTKVNPTVDTDTSFTLDELFYDTSVISNKVVTKLREHSESLPEFNF